MPTDMRGWVDVPGDDELRDEDLGGDPVCWLRRVCQACGAMADADPPTTCPACGAAMTAD